MTTNTRLRALVELADTGSVHAAADRLVVSESAISAAVSGLSAEVGVALIDRHGRGVRLTPAGQRYVEVDLPVAVFKQRHGEFDRQVGGIGAVVAGPRVKWSIRNLFSALSCFWLMS